MHAMSTRTRMDYQRKDHIDPKGPKQSNRSNQLQTQNLPSDDVENINSINNGRDLLSLFLFIIPMMLLNQILRKCTAVYKLRRSQEKINHLMSMDDIKLFAENEKEQETLIQRGHRNGIWH